jgi:hypothetical protein
MQLRGGCAATVRRIRMDHVVAKHDVRTLDDEMWLRDARSSFDVGATLTSALMPFWTVDRECDPSGDVSIIVLPAADTPAHPSFVLYEDNAVVQVSTFIGEDWRSRRTFRTCQRAVAAIIEAANLACPSAGQACRTSRTTRARSSVL